MPLFANFAELQKLCFMADNYLEKKFESLSNRRTVVVKRTNPSLDTLLRRNRSHRGYDKSRVVTEDELRSIVSVTTLVASASNRQVLRYKLVTKGPDADMILSHIRLAGALPELHLPQEGFEPEAFIVACTTVPETRYVDMDLGIAMQSMGLKAAEMGLNNVIICSFDKETVATLTGGFEPLAVMAIGKGAESIFLKPVDAGESLVYYRKDGVHYVPKLKLEDILV